MKSFLIFILCGFYFSCSNGEKKQEIIEEIEVVAEQVKEAVVYEQIEIPVLPFFDLQFEDEEFESFYYDLVKSCQEKDTIKVLNSIYDTLRFSKYECAFGQFVQSNDCDNCTRCTKEGMIQGIFGRGDAENLCERLFDMITNFGIGKFSDNKYYSNNMPIPNAYTNFHFIEDAMYENYFNYKAILPLHDKVEIKTEISTAAPTLGYLSFNPIKYFNEPGMGHYDELTESNWLEYEGGFINSKQVLTGFDYTLVIFERKDKGWKITGFFQPPGC